MKLKIIVNNLDWNWNKKTKELSDWFLPLKINIDVIQTNFESIPFEISFAPNYMIQTSWLLKNILPLATDYDILLFVVNKLQWKGVGTRGLRSWIKTKPIMTQVGGIDENTLLTEDGFNTWTENAFLQYARHEILHALFMLAGRPDTTHFWWDKRDLKQALLEVIPYLEQDISYKYFKSEEVKGLEKELVFKLDQARELAGIPFIISSGKRNEAYNKEIGGVKNSSHLVGKAVDISANTNDKKFKILKSLFDVGFKRMGIYEKHIHVDIDNTKPQSVIWG